MAKKTALQNKRYYLHSMVKKTCKEVRLIAKNRTLYVGYNAELTNKYVSQLTDLGYAIQTEIM